LKYKGEPGDLGEKGRKGDLGDTGLHSSSNGVVVKEYIFLS